ncbi:hypothetical protein KR093_008033 [Drosophila rubida]|uniref:Myotubularin-related protein 14 n=1 Tax=Drosophila rubida TaxID=30044 RepID=A0AAD4K0U9_9MUSC|nr:hypothetical protein KR093_008033 [Drosophila rubida]
MCSITLNEMVNVTQQDLHDLLEIFEKKAFEAVSFEEGTAEYGISKKCEYLFKLDYSLVELDNTNGLLSPRYPARIFIPEYEHGHMAKTLIPSSNGILTVGGGSSGTTATATPLNSSNCSNCSNGSNNIDDDEVAGAVGIQAFVTFANPLQAPSVSSAPPTLQATAPQPQPQPQPQPPPQPQPQQPSQQNTIYEDQYDVQRVRELVTMAKYARCRQRFVVPVIMYRGKYICRSATLSVMPETYGRKVVDYAYDCLSGNYAAPNGEDNESDSTDESLINEQINDQSQSQFSYDEVIKSDIQLLQTLNVSTIVDLMVENRKIKYFMAVSSSEKADPNNHYKRFNLLSLPYPGCEFFKKFRDNNYMAMNLHYNWKQSFNDADINIPHLGPAADTDIIWPEYRDWDLVSITQNYLRATLKYIQDDNAGVLIHCISGWDRTPLFVSLVRLSMWADGLIHQSLNALQIAYFTLAYDWYLFGHQLPDRLRRGEDILFFCFHVLKFITDEEFCVVEHRKRTKTSSSSGSSVIVIKSDCDDEPLKEDYVVAFDQDSNDSYSNCSNCDMSITDNFYATTAPSTTTPTASATAVNPLTSRSPNPKRSRTSPISVPGASGRQRQESTSSNGSWQVVTDTGSIDSTINSSYMMRFVSQQQQQQHQPLAERQDIPMGNCGNQYHCSLGNNMPGTLPNPSGGGSSNNSNSASGSNSSGNNTHGCVNGSSNNAANGSAPPMKPSLILRKQRLHAVRSIFVQAYGRTIGLKFKEGSTINLAYLVGNLADQLF